MTQSVPAQDSPTPAGPGGGLRLLVKGGLFLLLAILPALGVFALVRDGNDYSEATILKHRRLAETPGRRIVLVGGSNIAYGVDSAILEHETGYSVINMGMNGYLGVRYMLEEIKPFLRRSDIVLVAFEYDSFYKSVEGTAADQLMIVKANPGALRYLTWKQRVAAVEAIPYVAQQKILRLTREAIYASWSPLRMKLRPDLVVNDDPVLNDIESLAGFNDHGDLVSHLGVEWPYELEDGIDLSHTPLNKEAITLLQRFGEEMRARDVEVLVSYTPVIRQFYDQHQRAIDDLHGLMKQSSSLVVPSPPEAFVYDKPLFFDTVYHLNGTGRALRSERLAGDIVQNFNGGAVRPARDHPLNH